MNKILPIILVVVLSGCSGNTKTPLENCADEFVYNKSGLYIPGSFQEKLKKHDIFFKAAAKCEKLKKTYPESFDAKWK